MIKLNIIAATLATSLMLSGCGGSSSAGTSESAASDVNSDSAIWKRGGRWPIDEMGRTRIYHGVNVVRKFAPFYEERFGDDDAALLASEGFTAARIGFIWEAVEPQPGVYDDAYIRQIVGLDTLLDRYGIRTLVDFHQDAWSRQFTGDGAPGWATITSTPGLPTATLGASEAFAAFWRDEPAPDGIGIQTHFINAWQYVVPFLRHSKNVIGYDPFNEPYPGLDYGNPVGLVGPCGFFGACPEFEGGALSDFWDRVIPAIRELDSRHTIYVESVAGAHEFTLRTFNDSNLGFSYHIYCTVFAAQFVPSSILDLFEAQVCPQEEADGLDFGLAYAARAGTIASVTEFSAAATEGDNKRMVDLMGVRLLPWMKWQYYTKPATPIETFHRSGILVDDEAPASQENAIQAAFDSYVVPYPVAIAGTPIEYGFDRVTNVMTFKYSTAAAGGRMSSGATTLIFVPKRKFPTGYQVQLSGGRVVSNPTAAYLEIATNPGVPDVRVTVSPAINSKTEYPTPAELSRL